MSFGAVVLRGAPYVPSHRRQLDKAFDELYPLSTSDTLIDLGSGDGIVLHTAAMRGAKVIGYELNPFLVLFSKVRLRGFPSALVKNNDYLRLRELPRGATIVYAFTTSHSIEAIGRKMNQWSEGKTLYFISYGFKFKNILPLRSLGPMHLYEFKG